MGRYTAQDTNRPLFQSTENMAHPHRLCERGERERGGGEQKEVSLAEEHGEQKSLESQTWKLKGRSKERLGREVKALGVSSQCDGVVIEGPL